MLFNFFSKKKYQQDANTDVIKNNINNFLLSYRSDIFANGFYAIAQEVDIIEHDEAFVVRAILPFPCDGLLQELGETLSNLCQLPVNFDVQYHIQSVRDHNISGVKNIIAISSGKGGVGKSTTAVNLAYALIAEGANVGILDADVYGPSIPTMLGLKNQKPTSTDGKLITAFEREGLAAMSIGFLVDADDATVWRGPMASRAFAQLLNETDWPDLDYLIVDMPPGTGDIQLTLAQQVPVAAAIVITTPQDIALIDAVKGMTMFEKVNVPVLGIIENMSYYQCKHCGHHDHIFSHGGGEKISQQQKTTLLGQLPLDKRIQIGADNGKSIINENSTGELAMLYRTIARNVAAQTFYQFDKRSPNTIEIINLS